MRKGTSSFVLHRERAKAQRGVSDMAREQAVAELVSHQDQVKALPTGLLSEVLCCRRTVSL